jgi:hypothetical protein
MMSSLSNPLNSNRPTQQGLAIKLQMVCKDYNPRVKRLVNHRERVASFIKWLLLKSVRVFITVLILYTSRTLGTTSRAKVHLESFIPAAQSLTLTTKVKIT